jgi:hypothetical protein
MSSGETNLRAFEDGSRMVRGWFEDGSRMVRGWFEDGFVDGFVVRLVVAGFEVRGKVQCAKHAKYPTVTSPA